MAETASGTISVVCSCGKKLKAPATAVGKKAKCPKCGNVLTVKPPPPPPAEDDSFDALYDLAEQGEQHAQQQQLAPRCPSCMRELAPGAVLCTNCGYDTRSGKSIAPKAAAAPVAAAAAPPRTAATGTRYDPAAAAAAAANASKKVVDKMAPQGSFLKGVAASSGGAMIGAFVWFLVAWGTGYELYFLVLLVGALAGLGMQWGQEGYSYAGGFMAAGITFVTMVLARLAVVIALVVPMIRADAAADARQAEEERMPDLSQWDDRVVQQLFIAERKLQKPLPPASESRRSSSDNDEEEEEPLSPEERQEIAAYQEVEKTLKAMPKPQYEAMVKKFDDEEKARNLHAYVKEEILLNEVRVHPSNASSVEYASADKAAKERIAAMTPAKREEEYKRLHAKHEEEEKKEEAAWKAEMERRRANMTQDEIDSERAARNVGVAVGGFVILILVFGGFKGLIWTLLALGLAYRTASGSVTD